MNINPLIYCQDFKASCKRQEWGVWYFADRGSWSPFPWSGRYCRLIQTHAICWD